VNCITPGGGLPAQQGIDEQFPGGALDGVVGGLVRKPGREVHDRPGVGAELPAACGHRVSGEIEDTDATRSTDGDSGIGPVQAGEWFDLEVCGVRTVTVADPDCAFAGSGG
jgi:hypothetical protein